MSNPYDEQKFRYFDIETIPCQNPAYLDEIRATIKPPGNIKKPESIEKWMDENREQAALDIMAKTSLDGGRGHVCTISWAENAGVVKTLHAHRIGDEKGVLKGFFEALDQYHSETFVGHYIVGFDIPFLIQRAVVLGVEIPGTFPRDPKPWGGKINDTMYMWAGNKGKISMDNLCKILDIPGKSSFDGSMVAAAWANGEHKKIAEYAASDVERTREIHKRFLKAGW